MAFALGDVVTLKSAPRRVAMTVESVKDGKAACVWFAGCDVRRDSFPVDALMAVPRRP